MMKHIAMTASSFDPYLTLFVPITVSVSYRTCITWHSSRHVSKSDSYTSGSIFSKNGIGSLRHHLMKKKSLTLKVETKLLQ